MANFRLLSCGPELRKMDVFGFKRTGLAKLIYTPNELHRGASMFPARQLSLLALFLLALTGCDRAEKKQEVVKLKSAPKVDLDQVYSVGDYKKAIPLLQEHLKTNYSDGRNWFRLGYALHSENRLREAISAHEYAASYDASQAPTAIYNCACAYALLEEPEEALERLRMAVESGFNRIEVAREDPDLDSLRDLEEFKEIMQRMTKPRRDEAMSSRTELEFWVGDWDLEDRAGDKPIRTVVLQKQNGYLLTESWRGENDQSGTVMTFFDPREKKWKQNRIDNDGSIVYYTGEVEDGVVKFAGDFVNGDGSFGKRRITMNPNESQQMVDYLVEESADDGDTWSVTFRGRWIRRKPRLAE